MVESYIAIANQKPLQMHLLSSNTSIFSLQMADWTLPHPLQYYVSIQFTGKISWTATV